MADSRTFVLVGNFTDNISPALEKINSSLNSLKRNLGGFSARKGGFDDLTKSMGKVISAHKVLDQEVKNLQSSLRSSLTTLKEYRTEMGKTARANYSMTKSGTSAAQREAKFWQEAAESARQYKRELSGIRTPRSLPGPSPQPRRSASPPPYDGRGVPPTGGSRRAFAAAAGGAVAGSQLGDMLTNSVVRGFQIGASLMYRPFQYAAGAFGERIRDEMTDIQSAGGLFAVDQRKNLGLFRDFQQARATQEELNYRLAKSAAALPGSTAQYVQEAKRITDTMVIAMGKQPEQFVKLGEEFGSRTGDKLDALGAIIQKFTEKSVLLGKGGGGYRGIYSMPMLLEMMVNRPEVNAQSMGAKYAVLRDNPMLMNAIAEAEDEINKTGAGTADRLRVLMKVLDQALPNEVVQSMKNSMDGIIEVIKSSFLDPEVGLFGLGRKMKNIGPAVDQFGRFIKYVGDKAVVVQSAAEATQTDLSLFAILRDILGGFALPLSELAQILPELFDPLRGIGEGLIGFRNVAQRFYANFNQYTAEFEALAKDKGGKIGAEIKRTAGARGALLSVANLLRGFGAIDISKYNQVAADLQEYKPNLGAITGDLFKTLFNSDVMKMIGEAVGTLFGSTIKMVGDMMQGATDMATAGPFAEGLKKGWDAAQGSLGVSKIFANLFKIIGNVLLSIFKAAPLEMSILAALTVGMPLISGAISTGITLLFEKILDQAVPAATQPRGLPKPANLFTSDSSAAATRRSQAYVRLQRMRARKYLTEPIVQQPRLIRNPQFPNLALGMEPTPLTRGQKVQKFAQKAVRLPGKLAAGAAGAAKGLAAGGAKALAALPGAAALSSGFSRLAAGMSSVLPILSRFGNVLKPLAGAFKAITTNFGAQFLGAFKGVAGKLLIFGGILTTIISLFQGKGLAESLAEGAGPTLGSVLGGILGTALIPVLGPLGPLLGSLIGGWVGTLDAVTQPLTSAFGGLIGSVQPLLGILGQLWNDLSGLVVVVANAIGAGDKLGKGFNLLQIALFALLSPFKLLQIGILGIYEAYLEVKRRLFGLSNDEKKTYNDTVKARQKATDEFTIEGRQALGKSLAQLRSEEYKRWQEAKNKGDTKAQNDSARFMRVIEEKIRSSAQPRQESTPKGGQPRPAGAGGGAPRAVPTLTPAPVVGRPGFLTLGGKRFWRGTDGSLNLIVGGLSAPAPTSGRAGATPASPRPTPATPAVPRPTPAPTPAAPSVSPAAATAASAALSKVAASANVLSESANKAAISANALSLSTTKVGTVNNTLATSISSSGNKVVASNNTVSNSNNKLSAALLEGAKKTQAALTQQIATYARISSSWEKSNVSSQSKLSGAASGLAAAINNAASKLRSASAGIGSFGSNPGTTGNEGTRAAGKWDGKDRKPVPLQQAIEQEKKHMPSGAHLVIANSSETIIPADKREAVLPANKGLNLDGMAAGFGKFQGALNGLANMAEEFGGMGGAQGNLASAHALAKRFGLILTSYKRSGPASASYHNVGRAMDFSNGTGPTPQMLAYARMMAARYGRSLTELIYTPLGFGIKHGKKVAPYAASSHYNHVHVAYGMGAGNPAFFTSSAAADKWEMAMARREPIVSSVRAKASEVGGSYEITNNFTIVQQPGQDADSLASLVIMKLSMAVDQLRNHTA